MTSNVKEEAEQEKLASPKAAPRRARDDDEDAGEDSSRSKSYKKSKGGTAPPSNFESFEENEGGVTLQLLVKDSKGEIMHVSNLEKKEYSTGSFGWALADKVTVDNGEGGKMIVTLNGNCVIQGSKKNRKR